MNGRKARERARQEQQAIEAAIRAAPLEFIAEENDQEVWRRGPLDIRVAVIRDGYPTEIKDALMARRTAMFEGSCPCGAKQLFRQGALSPLRHAAECQASDENLNRLAEATAGVEFGYGPRTDET